MHAVAVKIQCMLQRAGSDTSKIAYPCLKLLGKSTLRQDGTLKMSRTLIRVLQLRRPASLWNPVA